MAVEGAIAEAARRQIPVTWDALLDDETRFGGEDSLEATVDYVKERIFGAVISTEAEDALPLVLVQWLGKLVALELIGPGIDYWMNMSIIETTTQPDERVQYTDRARELRERRKLLLEETRRDEAGMLPLVPLWPGQRHSGIPRTNTARDEFLTPSHQEFPRPYRVTERS
jgi:hypothetical protein